MMEESCLLCLYAGVELVDGEEALVCRFNAPQRVSGVGTGENNQLWPIVSNDRWCGEFTYHRHGSGPKPNPRPLNRGEN